MNTGVPLKNYKKYLGISVNIEKNNETIVDANYGNINI